MATDRHVGRGSPTFVVEGHPDKFIGLISRHGVMSRVMRARKCPCSTSTGSPDMYCLLCKGDGFVYDFQRKLLQVDEDSDVKKDRSLVYPFRVPILDVIKVERMLPDEQGGIKNYTIETFDALSIKIAGSPLPYHWNKMRVSYYFDRYVYVADDQVDVNPNTRMLYTTETLYDGEHSFGNALNIHGDIAIIKRIYSKSTGYEYTEISNFRKNQIILSANEPEPQEGDIYVDYYYVPPVPVLPAPLITQENKTDKWIMDLSSGNVRMGLDPFYDLSQGDLITLLAYELFRDEVIVHSSSSNDKLMEFDISRVDDDILDEDGNKYRFETDFILQGFRDLVWIGNQPQAGKKMSVRYSYRPTFIVFENNPEVNFLENKRYPVTVDCRLWGKTLQKDIERVDNPVYSNQFLQEIP